jgi:hypothetical protein
MLHTEQQNLDSSLSKITQSNSHNLLIHGPRASPKLMMGLIDCLLDPLAQHFGKNRQEQTLRLGLGLGGASLSRPMLCRPVLLCSDKLWCGRQGWQGRIVSSLKWRALESLVAGQGRPALRNKRCGRVALPKRCGEGGTAKAAGYFPEEARLALSSALEAVWKERSSRLR